MCVCVCVTVCVYPYTMVCTVYGLVCGFSALKVKLPTFTCVDAVGTSISSDYTACISQSSENKKVDFYFNSVLHFMMWAHESEVRVSVGGCGQV